MYYKITKTLGSIKAVLTESIPHSGICVEFNNYREKDPLILIYKDGINEDICINGWTLSCIYNNIENSRGSDVYGGDYSHVIHFELLDAAGKLHEVKNKKLYGTKQSQCVEYFYSLLYNISCCTDMEQIQLLYAYIIDNDDFHRFGKREEAIKVLNFIESFVPQLANIKDTDYLIGLRRKLDEKFEIAQKIIASADSPV